MEPSKIGNPAWSGVGRISGSSVRRNGACRTEKDGWLHALLEDVDGYTPPELGQRKPVVRFESRDVSDLRDGADGVKTVTATVATSVP